MEEFIKNNYINLTHLVEAIAAVTAIFCYKKYKNTAAKFFVFFLVYVFIIDFIGSYTSYIHGGVFEFLEGSLIEKNYWWFTICWRILGVLFLAFYYRKLLSNKFQKKVLKLVSIAFLFASVIYYIFNYEALFYEESKLFIVITGTLIILICFVFYFVEILQSERILNFYKSINFYISAVFFIWWLLTTPLIFYDVYYTTADWNFIILKWQIFLTANIFMYLMFTFALLWCNPEND
ncbi:hypothetical protein [Corallibacter sp.]|uniref:hypothetical protein n=1 Tax=Corallibacter sp. TaxID=2038084 RepID=UPI003AB415C4